MSEFQALAVTRRRFGKDDEAEMVAVEQEGKALVLHLDDGEDLIFHADEMKNALTQALFASMRERATRPKRGREAA